MNALDNEFFRDFSIEAREALLPHLKVEGFQNGVYLFHEGDAADGVCLLIEGEIEVLKKAGQREEQLDIIRPGKFLGEAAVLDGNGRSTSARARGHVVIVKVPTKPLLETLAREPVGVTIRLFQRVISYMRQTNELFVHEVIHKEKLALVGEMAASLMHDLRNPLAGIRLSADLLKMMHAQDEESRRCCEGIDIQCVRIAGMATDLLEVTRGEVQLHLQRVNTADFLEQFRTLNADFISRAAARIVFRTDPAEVEIDTLRVLRLLQNLVTNAVEATLQQADGLVEVEAWVQESRFLLTVKDNGPGLPAKVVENLYKPFSTHGKAGGTGLGMTIVKNVVEAHHGEITYKTGPGQGTSFFVNLPRFTTPPADPPSVPVPAGLNEALDETRSQITRSIALSTRALPRPRQT